LIYVNANLPLRLTLGSAAPEPAPVTHSVRKCDKEAPMHRSKHFSI